MIFRICHFVALQAAIPDPKELPKATINKGSVANYLWRFEGCA